MEAAPPNPIRQRGFAEDFRRFFHRGLAALLPTLITVWLVVWVWSFLWQYVGRHLIWVVKWCWLTAAQQGWIDARPAGYIARYWSDDLFRTRVVGVALAVVAIYIVGLLVGNLIGRTLWKLLELAVMKVPVVRAIYPAVKQVTDFVLSPRQQRLSSGRVVAVQPHEQGIWSVGIVTAARFEPLGAKLGKQMVTVFVPSSPTAFSGYVLVVPEDRVVELGMTVEEAMRLLISGGVVPPAGKPPAVAAAPGGGSTVVAATSPGIMDRGI